MLKRRATPYRAGMFLYGRRSGRHQRVKTRRRAAKPGGHRLIGEPRPIGTTLAERSPHRQDISAAEAT